MQQFFTKKSKRLLKLCQTIFLSICLTYFFSSSTVASTAVKKAEIYKIRNQVDINYKDKPDWIKAELGDEIIPRDSVRTGANSRADILFDEGTLVRTGAGTTFRFPPGKRRFELTSGAALVMIRPEQGESMISTPQAQVLSKGTALFLQHDEKNNASLIGVLTDSPAGLVNVSSKNGDVTLQLQAGQFVSIIQGVVGLVEHFVLPIFYETVELSAGLGTSPVDIDALIAQESKEVQKTIKAVREEAIAPLRNQEAWLKGFCRMGIETENLSPLLQLLGMGVSDAKVTLDIPETDLLVIPFRSLDGVTWLKNYCQADQILPGFEDGEN